MTKKRKAMSEKLRFEVFKRDSFRCVYCGKSGSDQGVVLHVDHQNPVAKGGDNNILNLVTACSSCNFGKGARKLDDNTVLSAQVKQMEEMQAKREMLKLMARWKEELRDAHQDAFLICLNYAQETPRGLLTLSNSVEMALQKALKKHPIEQVLDCIDKAQEKHIFSDHHEAEMDMIDGYSGSLVGLLKNLGRSQCSQKLAYVAGILKKRFPSEFNSARVGAVLENYIQATRSFYLGRDKVVSPEQQEQNDIFGIEKNLMPLSKEVGSLSHFYKTVDNWIAKYRQDVELAQSPSSAVTVSSQKSPEKSLIEPSNEAELIDKFEGFYDDVVYSLSKAVFAVYCYAHYTISGSLPKNEGPPDFNIWIRCELNFKAYLIEGFAWFLGHDLSEDEYCDVKPSDAFKNCALSEALQNMRDSFFHDAFVSEDNPAVIRLTALPSAFAFGQELRDFKSLEAIGATHCYADYYSLESPFETFLAGAAEYWSLTARETFFEFLDFFGADIPKLRTLIKFEEVANRVLSEEVFYPKMPYSRTKIHGD